jgi:hypothetical protein
MLPNIKKSHPKAAFISPVGREDSKSDLQHPMLAKTVRFINYLR